MEAAIGASMAGARALVCMKHVGLNVAADPFFSASYVGVKGGLVIVSADDPGMHSSQDEQDNRKYARFAKMPLVEPAEAGEAKALPQGRLRPERALRHAGAVPHHHADLALAEHRRTGRAGGGASGSHNARPRPGQVPDDAAQRTSTARLRGAAPARSGRVGRDHRAQPHGDGRPARRHRHLGRLVRLRPRGLPRSELPQAGAHLPAAAAAHRRVPRAGREAVRGRGTRPVPRGADPAPGDRGRRRQGPAPADAASSTPGLVARALSAAGAPGVDEDLLQTPHRPPAICPTARRPCARAARTAASSWRCAR